jgi:hypothetical protein
LNKDSKFLHHVYNSILSLDVIQTKNVLQKAGEGYRSLLLLMTTIRKFLPSKYTIKHYLLNILVYVAPQYVALVVIHYNLDIIFCKIQTPKCAN